MLWIPGTILMIIGLYSAVVFRVNRRVRAERRSMFLTRPITERSAWFQESFAGTGLDEKACCAVLTPIAVAVGCDLTQLRPLDAFTGQLAFHGMHWMGLDGGDPVQDYLEYELGLVIGDAAAESVQQRAEGLRTLLDFCGAVATTSAENGRSPSQTA